MPRLLFVKWNNNFNNKKTENNQTTKQNRNFCNYSQGLPKGILAQEEIVGSYLLTWMKSFDMKMSNGNIPKAVFLSQEEIYAVWRELIYR